MLKDISNNILFLDSVQKKCLIMKLQIDNCIEYDTN
jgi:hypothetical protein